MTWEIGVAITAILGFPLSVAGLRLVVRQQAREERRAQAEEKQRVYNEGFQDGVNHLQPTVDRLTSELKDSDARAVRAEQRSDNFENRYNDLRDRKGS